MKRKFSHCRCKVNSKGDGVCGGAVKVWLADTEPALFGHFWVSRSLLSALFSHISSVVAPFLMQPSFWSRLAAPEYSSELCDSIWTSAPGTWLNLLVNAYAHKLTPFKKNFFKSGLLNITIPPPPFHNPYRLRRFDSHKVMAYASLHLSSSAECVCKCVFSLLGV